MRRRSPLSTARWMGRPRSYAAQFLHAQDRAHRQERAKWLTLTALWTMSKTHAQISCCQGFVVSGLRDGCEPFLAVSSTFQIRRPALTPTVVRGFIALFGLMALILSGLHAGPVAAHGKEAPPIATAMSHGHGHFDASQDNDSGDGHSSPDLNSEQAHHHCPAGPVPRLPGSDLEARVANQIVFASEVSQLHSGSSAPPLDPPIT